MKLDIAIFEPNANELSIASRVFDFSQSGARLFTLEQLLSDESFRADEFASKIVADWFQSDRKGVLVGDLVCHRMEHGWICERLLEGTPHYYAFRLLPNAIKRFGENSVPSDNVEFITLIFRGREELLGREVETGPVHASIRDFVKERLSRCGVETFEAEVGSIAELCDIFDDYEYQKLMGRLE